MIVCHWLEQPVRLGCNLCAQTTDMYSKWKVAPWCAVVRPSSASSSISPDRQAQA
jgi:hypothetical protein